MTNHNPAVDLDPDDVDHPPGSFVGELHPSAGHIVCFHDEAENLGTVGVLQDGLIAPPAGCPKL